MHNVKAEISPTPARGLRSLVRLALMLNPPPQRNSWLQPWFSVVRNG